jgi:hypothetical protein
MKTTTESVLIVTNDKGVVIAMVRKDTGLQKNIVHRVSDALLSDIEGLLSGGNVDAVSQIEE